MVKKKRNNKFQISNKLAYTLIALTFIIGLGVGVIALTPGVAPNPGHTLASVSPASPCSTGQAIVWDGTNLVCSTPTAQDARFTIDSRGLCYNAPATCGSPIPTACTLPIRETTFTTIDDCLLTDEYDLIMDCTDTCLDLGVACNGDISTTCSGGTTAGYTMDSVKCGPGSGTNTAYCYCSPVSVYLKEDYTPPGQRCI